MRLRKQQGSSTSQPVGKERPCVATGKGKLMLNNAQYVACESRRDQGPMENCNKWDGIEGIES
jgi:hypothetical protein